MQSKRFIETLTDEQKETEKETRGQSVNPVWFEQKQNRITASICKDVFSHMHNQRSKIPENLIKKFQQKGNLISSTKEGLDQVKNDNGLQSSFGYKRKFLHRLGTLSGCWLAKVDLKHAYRSAGNHPDSWRVKACPGISRVTPTPHFYLARAAPLELEFPL